MPFQLMSLLKFGTTIYFAMHERAHLSCATMRRARRNTAKWMRCNGKKWIWFDIKKYCLVCVYRSAYNTLRMLLDVELLAPFGGHSAFGGVRLLWRSERIVNNINVCGAVSTYSHPFRFWVKRFLYYFVCQYVGSFQRSLKIVATVC